MPSFSILGAGESFSYSSCNNEDRPQERESRVLFIRSLITFIIERETFPLFTAPDIRLRDDRDSGIETG